MELKRFLDAQNQVYLRALNEITNGQKMTHWMWYVFPQLRGLGSSETSNAYGIADIEEACLYMQHPILGTHLIAISNALMAINGKTAEEIFGHIDALKLRSCMTLFANVQMANPIFEKVLDKFFGGIPDKRTLEMIGKKSKQTNTSQLLFPSKSDGIYKRNLYVYFIGRNRVVF